LLYEMRLVRVGIRETTGSKVVCNWRVACL
jgi:hypothetical protein